MMWCGVVWCGVVGEKDQTSKWIYKIYLWNRMIWAEKNWIHEHDYFKKQKNILEVENITKIFVDSSYA